MTLKQFLKEVNGKEEDIESYSDTEALRMVKQNGYALQLVKNQTEEICLEAVKRNGRTLQYVKQYKLIHKKHRNILDAWLANNSVEIRHRGDIHSERWGADDFKVDDFIDEYDEYYDFYIVQQYPIFKRNEDGEVFKITSSGSSGTEYETMLCEDFDGRCILSGKTIPHDKGRGLYHLQPIWCWDNIFNFKRDLCFYDAEKEAVIRLDRCDRTIKYENIEPVTPEQLETMPFVWEMYQQVLKDKQ